MPARAAGSRVSSRCGARAARSHPITPQRSKPFTAPPGREDSRRLAFLLLAIVGSALIGAGIILLIAHNWDELSRPVRSAIAFLPLLASHALSVFVLRRRDGSQPWRESAAIFNIAAIGAAISLVSQTYQIHGDFARFVLVWMLLALPLVYLLRSTLASCAYLVGCIVWVMSTSDRGAGMSRLWFWLLAAAVLPHAVALFRSQRLPSATLLAILLTVAAAFGLAATNGIAAVQLWAPSYAGLFALIYLAGCAWFRQSDDHQLHPLVVIGFSSTVVLSIILSFQEFWRFGSWTVPQSPGAQRVIAIGIAAIFVASPFVVLPLVRRRGIFSFNPMALALPLVAALAWAIAQSLVSARPAGLGATDLTIYMRGDAATAFWLALLLSLYALSFGVFTLVRGLRGGRFVEANVGLVIIAALALARFFDTDLGFVARGVAFVVVGVGFLGANLMLFRRRAHAP